MSQQIAMLSSVTDGDTEDEALVLGRDSRLGAAKWAVRAAKAAIAVALMLTALAAAAAVATPRGQGTEAAEPKASSSSAGLFLPSSNVLDDAVDGVISLQGGGDQCAGFPPAPACIIDTSGDGFFEATQADSSTVFCYVIDWESSADLSHIQWEFDQCVCDQFGGGVSNWEVLDPEGNDVSNNFDPEYNFKGGCNFKLNTKSNFVNPGETFQYCFSIPSQEVCVCDITLMVSKDGHCGDRECPNVYGPCCECDATTNPVSTTEPVTTPETGDRTLTTTPEAATTAAATTAAATTAAATTAAGTTAGGETTTPPVGGGTATTAPLTSSGSNVFTTTEQCPLVPNPNPGDCNIPCDLDTFNKLFQLHEIMGGNKCVTGDTLGAFLASKQIQLPRSLQTCDSVWATIENGPTESNPDVPVECQNKQEMLYQLCSPMCKFCEKCICS